MFYHSKKNKLSLKEIKCRIENSGCGVVLWKKVFFKPKSAAFPGPRTGWRPVFPSLVQDYTMSTTGSFPPSQSLHLSQCLLLKCSSISSLWSQLFSLALASVKVSEALEGLSGAEDLDGMQGTEVG